MSCCSCAAPAPWSSRTSARCYAARDRHGVRPLVLGRLEHGWAVASEPAALDIVGATFVREETVLRVAQAAGWTAWLLGDVREAACHTA